MSDLGAGGELVHSGGESVAPAWPAPAMDGPRLAWMETIVSKTTTDGHVMTAKGEVLERELSLEELEAVSGGEIYIEFGGYKVTSSDVVDAAKWVWNKLF